MIRNVLSAGILLAALGLPASAQLARGLVREGDAPAGLPAGQTIASVGEPAVNHVGGFAAGLTTNDGVTPLSHLWGSTTPAGAPAILRTEGTVNNLVQTSFEAFWGFADAGQASYSPLCDDNLSGATSLDCIFVDNTVIAQEGQPIASLPGRVWRFASRPGITAAGLPYWVGGTDDASTGADLGRALFFNTIASVVLKSGDVPGGASAPIDIAGIDFDYRFSAGGIHYITPIDTTEPTTSDGYMVADGLVLMAGMSVVKEGSPVPASIGGLPGENWDNFDFCGITDAGEYFFSGDTDASVDDEILVKNGEILYRKGQTLDGETLTGAIDDASMNNHGDIAFIWDVVDATSGSLEALFVNDVLVLKQGDAVDFDGDGVIEPTSTLVNLSDVVIGDNSVIYLVATVDTLGTPSTGDDFDTLFRVECQPVPYGVGKLNSAGTRARMGWSGEPSLAAGNFLLEVSDLTASNIGIGFWGSGRAMQPAFKHFFYVASPVTRILPAQYGSASGSVSLAIPIDLSMVGTTRYYQYWQRDPDAADSTGVELSSALAVTFCN